MAVPREDILFKPPSKQEDADIFRFVMDYSSHSDELREILTKHWSVLTSDKTIARFIHSKPQIGFRRTPSLKDKLVHSHFKNNDDQMADIPVFGTVCCSKCAECQVMRNVRKFRLPNGRMFFPRQHITCQTVDLVNWWSAPMDDFMWARPKELFTNTLKITCIPLRWVSLLPRFLNMSLLHIFMILVFWPL